ncbi:MAG TPA: PmoA family protein [Phycisphaerae bacterium]|nr:PmoA family protein [Phycisphaerae bacterium]
MRTNRFHLTIACGILATAISTSLTRGADTQCSHAPVAGPVCLKPPKAVEPLKEYRLDSTQGPFMAQTDADGRLWAWGRVLMKDGKAYFAPAPSPMDCPDAGVKVTQVKDGLIEIKIDGKLFTEFRWGDDEPKPFLWPVIGPTGEPVTRAYPMKDLEAERKDHIHHRSIWTAWGDIRTTNLKEPGSNYWLQTKDPRKQDRQIVRKIVRTVSGPVFGQIVAEIDWVHHSGRRDFSEVRTYTFHRGDESNRMIDVRNVFKFDDGEVMFADTKEAGILSIRIATSMDEITLDKKPGPGVMRNSVGGKGSGECWGRPAAWCDYVGPVEGQTIGIAVFDNPKNPGHPPRWHIRDYGLFTVNPYGIKDFPDGKGKDGSHLFKKGEKTQFDYRIVIHKGDTDTAKVADQYKLYRDTPTAAVP